MTVSDLTRFVRARKGTVLSVTLHVLVLGWGLFSFSARSMVAPPEDLVPVDVISEDNTSKAKAGALTGKKVGDVVEVNENEAEIIAIA